MNTIVKKINNIEIAIVQSDEVIIKDAQSTLDFIATVGYETNCNRVIINKNAIIEEFFDLSTCIAGEALQKIINYDNKIAIVGDFSCYTSKSLKDFIYESNSGKDIFFVSSEQEAIEKLTAI